MYPSVFAASWRVDRDLDGRGTGTSISFQKLIPLGQIQIEIPWRGERGVRQGSLKYGTEPRSIISLLRSITVSLHNGLSAPLMENRNNLPTDFRPHETRWLAAVGLRLIVCHIARWCNAARSLARLPVRRCNHTEHIQVEIDLRGTTRFRPAGEIQSIDTVATGCERSAAIVPLVRHAPSEA